MRTNSCADESLIERWAYRLLLVGVELLLIVAILVALVMLAVRSARGRRPT